MESHEGGGGGAGEVRLINVVCFLSRGGRTDHPHLFRVNHHNRAGGVRLRDVKRWLSELRGKDMPDNFSWSYKRKYKAGHVWQGLKDGDLITPVSDNEYVLKGCDVQGTPPPCVQAPKTASLDEKEQTEKEEKTPCNHQNRPVEVVLTCVLEKEVVLTSDSDESSPKPLPPPLTDQDSPGAEPARRKALFKIDLSRHHHEHKQQQEEAAKKAVTRAVARAGPEEQLQGAAKSHAVAGKARRMRVARALHNILTCGAADADDAALRPVARRQRRSTAEAAGDDWPPTPTCPGMDGCGLRVGRKVRSQRGGKDKQGKRDGRKRDGRGAHKPAALPLCSQCGREFKPQELHSHMQSCRGFKERMRSSTSARTSVGRSRNSTSTARPADHGSKPGQYSPERRSSSASAVFLITES
ncbi:protein SOSEKI 1-like [Phragmites australis]|uniref:protein SOSEKI 1-like n=1 Tax=Phragmites australis TaxID=29695 RepID=UPI002D79C6C8|nr:protein SOSEKI 1-like [Phragmites australis]